MINKSLNNIHSESGGFEKCYLLPLLSSLICVKVPILNSLNIFGFSRLLPGFLGKRLNNVSTFGKKETFKPTDIYHNHAYLRK